MMWTTIAGDVREQLQVGGGYSDLNGTKGLIPCRAASKCWNWPFHVPIATGGGAGLNVCRASSLLGLAR